MSEINIKKLQYDRYVVANDIHFGDEDQTALDLIVKYMVDTKCENLLSAGDVFDLHWMSIFSKSIDADRVDQEFEKAKQFDDVLKKHNINWIIKGGNHEARMKKIKPSLQKLINIPSLFKSYEFRTKYVDDQTIFIRNGLAICHGHEKGSGGGNVVNPARYIMDKAKMSVLCGHWHRESVHSTNRLDGTLMCAWSTGHLSNPNPGYRIHNDWIQGIADVRFSGTKRYNVKLHKIYKGEFI